MTVLRLGAVVSWARAGAASRARIEAGGGAGGGGEPGPRPLVRADCLPLGLAAAVGRCRGESVGPRGKRGRAPRGAGRAGGALPGAQCGAPAAPRARPHERRPFGRLGVTSFRSSQFGGN